MGRRGGWGWWRRPGGWGSRCTCWRRGTTRGRWPGRRWRVGRTRSGWPAGTGRWGWWRRWRGRPGCRSCACPRGPGTTSPGTWGWTGGTRWPRWRPSTAHAVLPASLRGERELLRVDLRDADGREHPDVLVLLVACNPYALNGVRERMDGGLLQVSALRARTGAALAGLATRALARGGRVPAGTGWAQWTTTVLRVLVPPALASRTLRPRLHRWSTLRGLLRVAAGSGGDR